MSDVVRNREGWLTELAAMLRPVFRGFTVGPYRVTCGWPCKGGTGKSGRRVGECHFPKGSSDRTHELFISPLLDDPAEVGGTLAHELAHVAAGLEAAHGRGFLRVCRHVGLTRGRPASVGPGRLLGEEIRKMTDRLGLYPHKKMILVAKAVRPAVIVGLACPSCDCRVTISKRWVDEAGLPMYGCGTTFGPKEG